MNGGVTIPDKDTARALNDLARHKAIVRILNDIRMDMEICEIEGWDKNEYLNLIRELLNSIGAKTMGDLISRQTDCVLTEFGNCSYPETGCSECAVKEKIRNALSAQWKRKLMYADVSDTISRQAAIDAVIDELKRSPTPAIRAKFRLEALPSAQPERKKGRWEQVEVSYLSDMDAEIKESMAIASMFCPKCKRYHNEVYLYGNPTFGVNFCPNCGARMQKGGQNE